jgi:hypothetical protein
VRNERLSKTIADEEQRKLMRKRNNTVDHKNGQGEEHKENDDQQPDFKKQLQIF